MDYLAGLCIDVISMHLHHLYIPYMVCSSVLKRNPFRLTEKVGFRSNLERTIFTYTECAIFGCLEAVYLAKIDGGTTVRLIELSPGFASLTGTWRQRRPTRLSLSYCSL